MRSGTENVPGIAGMALAAEMTYRDLDANVAHMRELKEHLIDELTQIDDVYSNSGDAPDIASITFKGVRSEVMLWKRRAYMSHPVQHVRRINIPQAAR